MKKSKLKLRTDRSLNAHFSNFKRFNSEILKTSINSSFYEQTSIESTNNDSSRDPNTFSSVRKSEKPSTRYKVVITKSKSSHNLIPNKRRNYKRDPFHYFLSKISNSSSISSKNKSLDFSVTKNENCNLNIDINFRNSELSKYPFNRYVIRKSPKCSSHCRKHSINCLSSNMKSLHQTIKNVKSILSKSLTNNVDDNCEQMNIFYNDINEILRCFQSKSKYGAMNEDPNFFEETALTYLESINTDNTSEISDDNSDQDASLLKTTIKITKLQNDINSHSKNDLVILKSDFSSQSKPQPDVAIYVINITNRDYQKILMTDKETETFPIMDKENPLCYKELLDIEEDKIDMKLKLPHSIFYMEDEISSQIEFDIIENSDLALMLPNEYYNATLYNSKEKIIFIDKESQTDVNLLISNEPKKEIQNSIRISPKDAERNGHLTVEIPPSAKTVRNKNFRPIPEQLQQVNTQDKNKPFEELISSKVLDVPQLFSKSLNDEILKISSLQEEIPERKLLILDKSSQTEQIINENTINLNLKRIFYDKAVQYSAESENNRLEIMSTSKEIIENIKKDKQEMLFDLIIECIIKSFFDDRKSSSLTNGDLLVLKPVTHDKCSQISDFKENEPIVFVQETSPRNPEIHSVKKNVDNNFYKSIPLIEKKDFIEKIKVKNDIKKISNIKDAIKKKELVKDKRTPSKKHVPSTVNAMQYSNKILLENKTETNDISIHPMELFQLNEKNITLQTGNANDIIKENNTTATDNIIVSNTATQYSRKVSPESKTKTIDNDNYLEINDSSFIEKNTESITRKEKELIKDNKTTSTDNTSLIDNTTQYSDIFRESKTEIMDTKNNQMTKISLFNEGSIKDFKENETDIVKETEMIKENKMASMENVIFLDDVTQYSEKGPQERKAETMESENYLVMSDSSLNEKNNETFRKKEPNKNNKTTSMDKAPLIDNVTQYSDNTFQDKKIEIMDTENNQITKVSLLNEGSMEDFKGNETDIVKETEMIKENKIASMENVILLDDITQYSEKGPQERKTETMESEHYLVISDSSLNEKNNENFLKEIEQIKNNKTTSTEKIPLIDNVTQYSDNISRDKKTEIMDIKDNQMTKVSLFNEGNIEDFKGNETDIIKETEMIKENKMTSMEDLILLDNATQYSGKETQERKTEAMESEKSLVMNDSSLNEINNDTFSKKEPNKDNKTNSMDKASLIDNVTQYSDNIFQDKKTEIMDTEDNQMTKVSLLNEGTIEDFKDNKSEIVNEKEIMKVNEITSTDNAALMHNVTQYSDIEHQERTSKTEIKDNDNRFVVNDSIYSEKNTETFTSKENELIKDNNTTSTDNITQYSDKGFRENKIAPKNTENLPILILPRLSDIKNTSSDVNDICANSIKSTIEDEKPPSLEFKEISNKIKNDYVPNEYYNFTENQDKLLSNIDKEHSLSNEHESPKMDVVLNSKTDPEAYLVDELLEETTNVDVTKDIKNLEIDLGENVTTDNDLLDNIILKDNEISRINQLSKKIQPTESIIAETSEYVFDDTIQYLTKEQISFLHVPESIEIGTQKPDEITSIPHNNSLTQENAEDPMDNNPSIDNLQQSKSIESHTDGNSVNKLSASNKNDDFTENNRESKQIKLSTRSEKFQSKSPSELKSQRELKMISEKENTKINLTKLELNKITKISNGSDHLSPSNKLESNRNISSTSVNEKITSNIRKETFKNIKTNHKIDSKPTRYLSNNDENKQRPKLSNQHLKLSLKQLRKTTSTETKLKPIANENKYDENLTLINSVNNIKAIQIKSAINLSDENFINDSRLNQPYLNTENILNQINTLVIQDLIKSLINHDLHIGKINNNQLKNEINKSKLKNVKENKTKIRHQSIKIHAEIKHNSMIINNHINKSQITPKIPSQLSNYPKQKHQRIIVENKKKYNDNYIIYNDKQLIENMILDEQFKNKKNVSFSTINAKTEDEILSPITDVETSKYETAYIPLNDKSSIKSTRTLIHTSILASMPITGQISIRSNLPRLINRKDKQVSKISSNVTLQTNLPKIEIHKTFEINKLNNKSNNQTRKFQKLNLSNKNSLSTFIKHNSLINRNLTADRVLRFEGRFDDLDQKTINNVIRKTALCVSLKTNVLKSNTPLIKMNECSFQPYLPNNMKHTCNKQDIAINETQKHNSNLHLFDDLIEIDKFIFKNNFIIINQQNEDSTVKNRLYNELRNSKNQINKSNLKIGIPFIISQNFGKTNRNSKLHRENRLLKDLVKQDFISDKETETD